MAPASFLLPPVSVALSARSAAMRSVRLPVPGTRSASDETGASSGENPSTSTW